MHQLNTNTSNQSCKCLGLIPEEAPVHNLLKYQAFRKLLDRHLLNTQAQRLGKQEHPCLRTELKSLLLYYKKLKRLQHNA